MSNIPQAGAGNSPDLNPNAAGSFGDILNQIGDASFFKHFQRSGKLDFLDHAADGSPKPNGNHVVYPIDLHNNPEYGQLIHFDVFFKKNPRMEDLTSSISSVFDSLADGIGDLYSGTVDALGEAATGTVVNEEGGIDVGGVGGFIGNIADQGAVKILNFISDKSQLPEFVNEEIIKDTRLGKAEEESLDKITLYLPADLKNADSIGYQEVDLGLIKGIMDGNLSSMIPGVIQKAAGIVDSVAEIAGGQINSADAISSITGAVRNPRKEQLFESVGFRTFDFTFTFRPKNEQEAIDMLTICKLFRFHAHPEVNPSQAYYLTPSEFQITFIDLKHPNPVSNKYSTSPNHIASENQWINKIGRCALTAVNVDYHPNGVVSTFENGIPTAIDLQLSFTEMEAITRNHIHAGF